MSPNFAQAVDRIFLPVLGLLDRLQRNEAVTPQEERTRLRLCFDQADATLGQSSDWQLARYALAAWIDDLLIEAPWEGRQWWEENALEVEFFNSRDAYTTFYTKAVEAAALPKKDALEVFYVCVVLGFRGMYRDASNVVLAEQMKLPADLHAWTKQTAMAIRLGQGRPPINEVRREGAGAPPLEGRFRLVQNSLIAVLAAAGTLGLALWLFGR